MPPITVVKFILTQAVLFCIPVLTFFSAELLLPKYHFCKQDREVLLLFEAEYSCVCLFLPFVHKWKEKNKDAHSNKNLYHD